MSEKCLRFINQLETEVLKYEADHAAWRQRRNELIVARDAAFQAFEKADIALSQTQPNSHYTATRRDSFYGNNSKCSDWSDGACERACRIDSNYKTTPGGRRSIVGHHRPSSYNSGCPAGRWNCNCQIVNWDASAVTKLKTQYDDLVRQLKDHETIERKPPPIDVSCCRNEILCNGGKCYGNIQVCKNFINNLSSIEDENKIVEQINLMYTLFNKELQNFNNSLKELEDYYKNFKVLRDQINNNKNLNTNSIFFDMKNLYSFAETSYNILFKSLESIYNYYGAIIENNGRIKTSSLKTSSNSIINSITPIVKKVTSDYQSIIIKYDEIKTFWERLELEKNNLNSMFLKKNLIDDYLKNFNIDIENINTSNIQVKSLIPVNDTDIVTLLKLVDNMNKSFNNQIINNTQSINNLFNEIKVLFNTISPISIFFNTANEIFTAVENTNILLNNKFNTIKEVINSVNSIASTKKTNYETEKKINEDKKILFALEEQDNKRKSDLLLLELIENEEKKLLEKSNQTTTINITDIIDKPLFTQIPITPVPEPAKMDYTIYIIVGVVVIIVLIFFMKK